MNKIKEKIKSINIKNIKSLFTKENLKKFIHMPGVVYVILMILFTAVLIADLIIYVAVPANSRASMASRSEMSFDASEMSTMFNEDANLNEDADSNDSAISDGEATEDGSADDMSEGMGRGGMDMSEMTGDMSEMAGGEMPTGDMSEMAGGEMPTGDMSQMQGGAMMSGDTESSDEEAAADGDDTSDAIGDIDSAMTLPDGMDITSMDMSSMDMAGMTTSSSNGVLSRIRRMWLPILVICILGDIICALLFRRKRRKLMLAEEPEEELSEEELIALAQEHKKRKRRLWAIPIAIILIITIVIASLPTTGISTSTVTVNEEVLSGEAGASTISAKLSGAGTLGEDDTVSVTVPDVVTISTYYVENGDIVEEGDIIALADKDSVGVAIAELQDVIDELDGELAEEADETPDDEITAAVDGRVKMIYAEEGTEVTDTVYSYGALMVLSLDGCMAVQIETDADLSIDDTVTVELSDGSTEDGRVAAISVSAGTITFTISDETADCGDEVTVYDEDGNKIGTGTLYIHSELKVMGYYGTVDDIEVSLNEEVDAGDTLITLTDTGHTATYTALLNRRYELEDQMEALFALYATGYVYAESEGVVSGVPDDATIGTLVASADDGGILLASDTGSEAYVSSLVSTSGSYYVSLMKNEPESDVSTSSLINYVGEVVSIDTKNETMTLNVHKNTINIKDYANDLDGVSSYKLNATMELTYSGIEDYYYYDSESESWETIEISELSEGDKLLITFLSEIVSEDVYDEDGNITSSSSTEVLTLCWIISVTDSEETEAETEEETEEETEAETSGNAGEGTGNNDGQNGGEGAGDGDDQNAGEGAGDGDDQNAANNGADANQAGQQAAGSSMSISSGTTAMSGSSTGSDVASAVSGMTAEETYAYETYSIDEKDVIVITPQDTMTVAISIDELDILSLSVGLEVEVTLDAIKGQSFDGVVTSIGSSGTNSGGNTKYTVTVTLDRTSQMLDGMNASVKIVTDSTDAEVTIPVAALIEQDGKTYVYTTYDEKTDTLGGMVEVETGVADEDNVEITSGLESGDSYYYRYAQSITYNFLSGLFN